MSQRVRELPPTAAPLGADGWEPPVTESNPLPTVTCPCGWHGSAAELLAVGDPPDDPNIQQPFYCPQCHRNGWEGWTWD